MSSPVTPISAPPVPGPSRARSAHPSPPPGALCFAAAAPAGNMSEATAAGRGLTAAARSRGSAARSRLAAIFAYEAGLEAGGALLKGAAWTEAGPAGSLSRSPPRPSCRCCGRNPRDRGTHVLLFRACLLPASLRPEGGARNSPPVSVPAGNGLHP